MTARSMSDAVHIAPADLENPAHATAVVRLLDHYASDPMGGGMGLSDATKRHLIARLRERPGVLVLLAHEGELPVGLAICFEGFSTFAATPLLNVHDLVVLESHRGRGLGPRLLATLEAIAIARGYCKLTLEVLEDNAPARAAYARAGFGAPDSTLGRTFFLEKKLSKPSPS